MSGPTLPDADVRAIVTGRHADPFAVLGPHRVEVDGRAALAVRAFLPGAARVRLLNGGAGAGPREMARLHPDGLFEGVVAPPREPLAYRLEVVGGDGRARDVEDPYRFPSTLSDYDRHLLAEGTHADAHERLGAHRLTLEGVAGTVFAL